MNGNGDAALTPIALEPSGEHYQPVTQVVDARRQALHARDELPVEQLTHLGTRVKAVGKEHVVHAREVNRIHAQKRHPRVGTQPNPEV